MATHSTILARRILWTEEPGGLLSIESPRVGHDWSNLACIGEGNGNPLQYSCLENPRDRGAWWSAVYGVVQGRTQLKRLSSSSSLFCCFAQLFRNREWSSSGFHLASSLLLSGLLIQMEAPVYTVSCSVEKLTWQGTERSRYSIASEKLKPSVQQFCESPVLLAIM